jgi:hypothetical protein
MALVSALDVESFSSLCTNFTNLFCHETLHVSDSSSVHHQGFILILICNKNSFHISYLLCCIIEASW